MVILAVKLHPVIQDERPGAKVIREAQWSKEDTEEDPCKAFTFPPGMLESSLRVVLEEIQTCVAWISSLDILYFRLLLDRIIVGSELEETSKII